MYYIQNWRLLIQNLLGVSTPRAIKDVLESKRKTCKNGLIK